MEIDLVPIVMFVCMTFVIKLIVDARMRYLLLRGGVSEQLLGSILLGEEQQRRHASLRWGVILVAVGAGFALIHLLGWREITAGAIAVLAIATGLGNLAVYALTRRLK